MTWQVPLIFNTGRYGACHGAVDRPRAAGGQYRVLTLNRPEKKNALSIALRDAVSDALETLQEDPSLKCVVLTGAGTAFSAGFDLSEFQAAFADRDFHARLWASSDRYHRALLCFPLPIVAAVNGPALGGGMDTAVLCDIRVMADAARFGHPEAAFGEVVYAPLHDLIGGAAARELCLTGRVVDSAEAMRLGLVSEVSRTALRREAWRLPDNRPGPARSPPAHQGEDHRPRRDRFPRNPGTLGMAVTRQTRSISWSAPAR